MEKLRQREKLQKTKKKIAEETRTYTWRQKTQKWKKNQNANFPKKETMKWTKKKMKKNKKRKKKWKRKFHEKRNNKMTLGKNEKKLDTMHFGRFTILLRQNEIRMVLKIWFNLKKWKFELCAIYLFNKIPIKHCVISYNLT